MDLTLFRGDLIDVYHNSNGDRIVNARDLHEFLKVKSRYNDWINLKLKKYDFIENEDFTTVTENLVNGGIKIDHLLKLGVAKEISMVENNKKGREARKYFIEVEERAKEVFSPSYVIQDPIKRAERWIEEQKQIQTLEIKTLMLEQQVAEAQPKLTYYDTILNSTKLVTVTAIAKDYGLSAQELNNLLHRKGIQYKQSKQWFLYQDHADKGYTMSHTSLDANGEPRMNTKWTQKGRLFIHSILTNLGYDPDNNEKSLLLQQQTI